MKSKQTKQEIDELEAFLAPHQTKLEALQRRYSHELSMEYIDVNGISRDNVERPDGQDKPYFYHIVQFSNWLKTYSKKQWAEWNGRIYRTRDLISGRMPDSPAYYDDVP